MAVALAAAGAYAQTADFEVLVARDVTGVLNAFTVTPQQGTGFEYIVAGDAFSGITISGGSYAGAPNEGGFAGGVVTFAPSITASGSYTFTFPEGAFVIGQNAANALPTKQKTVSVDVTVVATSGAAVNLTPAYGSAIDVAADGTASFVLSFTTPVNLTEYTYGKNRLGNIGITPQPAEGVYADTYTCTFPKAYIDQIIYGWDPQSGLGRTVDATFYAYDREGNRVYRTGEDGRIREDLNVQYSLNVDAPAGAPFNVQIGAIEDGKVSSFLVTPAAGFSYIEPLDESAWDDEAQTYVNFFKNITITGPNDFVAKPVSVATGEGEDSAPFNGKVEFTPAITESGSYTLNIPYHAFQVAIESSAPEGQGGSEGDVTFWSQAKTLDFTIDFSAFVVPAPSLMTPFKGVAERLENMVSVTWGYYALEDNAGDGPMQATLTFPDGTAKVVNGSITTVNGEEIYDIDKMPADEDNALMFRNFMTLGEDAHGNLMYVQQYGRYTLEIPAGVVLVNGTPNPQAVLSFVITGSGSSEEPTPVMGYATLIDPESEYVASCLGIQLTWNDGTPISLVDASGIWADVDGTQYKGDDIEAYITFFPDEEDPGIGIMTLSEGDEEMTGEILQINLPFDVFGQTGDFRFYIPKGVVKDNTGAVNPEQTVLIQVLPTTDGELKITPTVANYEELTVETLPTVTLNWGKPVSLNEPCYVRLDLPDLSPVFLAEENLVDIDDETFTVTLNVADYTKEDGTYAIVLPEGAFLIGGMLDLGLNQEGYYTYIVSEGSGVAAVVEAQDGRYEVYGIDGTAVMNTTDPSALSTLEKGRLYIINGKAVFVR